MNDIDRSCFWQSFLYLRIFAALIVSVLHLGPEAAFSQDVRG